VKTLLAAVAAVFAPQAALAYHFEADVLGTRANFVLSALNGPDALAAYGAALAEIARLGALFHPAPTASPELDEVMAAAEAMRTASNGAFDARLGLNGIAKGYIVDRALAAGLAAAPVKGMLVDIGGDMACKGIAPDGAWIVGLTDPQLPYDNAPLVCEVALQDQAIATSGLGPRGQQTTDPRTGLPPTNFSATVVAATAMQADAFATALLVLDPEEGAALADRTPGIEAQITGADGAVTTTSGWLRLAQNTLPPKREASKPWANWQALTTFTAPRRVLERDPDFRSPYVAMWVTDKNNKPVRTLILVGRKPDWQRDNYIWWALYKTRNTRLVDVRSMSTSLSGQYNVFWDGVDDDGKPVALGDYILHVETSREKGKHTYRTMPVTFGKASFKAALPKTEEGGGIAIAFDRY